MEITWQMIIKFSIIYAANLMVNKIIKNSVTTFIYDI